MLNSGRVYNQAIEGLYLGDPVMENRKKDEYSKAQKIRSWHLSTKYILPEIHQG